MNERTISKYLIFTLAIFFLFSSLSVARANRTRMDQFIEYEEQHNWAAALETIREEIRSPSQGDKNYLVVVCALAINSLGKYAGTHGWKPEMDSESQRYYREAAQLCSKDEEDALLAPVMGNYYSLTGRNGLALPYFRREGDYYKKVNNVYILIKNYDSLANCYDSMGQLALSDYYRKEFFDLAKTYFVPNNKKASANEWVQYNGMLEDYATGLAIEGLGSGRSVTNLLETWIKIEPIVKKYVFPKHISYRKMANNFAVAGFAIRARKVWNQAQRMAIEESKSKDWPGLDIAGIELTISDAIISFYEGNYEHGAQAMERGLKAYRSKNFSPGESALRHAGLLYDALGDFDRGIDYFRQSIKGSEVSRSSFAVADRVAFFKSKARKSYWGLMRCYTKKYLKNKNESDFLEALNSTELVRGRAFGEVLEERGRKVSALNVNALSSLLGPDDLLLNYMFMDMEILLFAFTKDSHNAFILPYNRKEFGKQIISITAKLADPEGDQQMAHRQLAFISQTVLSPVREMIKQKKRIIVLPDGLLNAVPFDLLPLEDTPYRPIIAEKEVLNAPSLKYLLQAKKKRGMATGLFAMADPAYALSINRGSKYLLSFPPLPETRMEVKAIASMYRDEPVKILYGKDAKKSALLKADLQPYGHLHFATHGILGGEVPGVEEPALVFAEEKEGDCFLMASDAEKLKLNADLAVLSACNTGTGEYFTGEGVMGISRSFLLAGSRSVVVSLWSVPSGETELLMVNFYRNLRNGMEAPAAMRKAKLAIMTPQAASEKGNVDKRGVATVHPFYWASFIVFGGI